MDNELFFKIIILSLIIVVVVLGIQNSTMIYQINDRINVDNDMQSNINEKNEKRWREFCDSSEHCDWVPAVDIKDTI